MMYATNPILSKQNRINSSQLSMLHTFEAVARHNSFSLAADELSLTPSAISHRVKKLEDAIGIQLFERSHRKIMLTREGERIYRSLNQLLNALNEEINQIKNEDVYGILTVYSRPSFAKYCLVPHLSLFRELYPSITLNLLTGNENVDLRQFDIDVAIYFDENMPSEFFCKELMTEKIIPVCTKEYADSHDLLNNTKNLCNATILHDNQAWDYSSEQQEWSSWAKANQVENVKDIPCIGFDRSDLAIDAARNNIGIAMGRYSFVEKMLTAKELITPFPSSEIACEQKYYIATLKSKRTPKVRLFEDWLHRICNKTEHG